MANLKLIKNDNYVKVIIKESGDNWTSFINKSKKNLIDNLELKGFRKGNVPEKIAEQNISKKNIWHKAADLLIEVEYSKAIQMLTKEKIATRPTFDINKVTDEEIEAELKSVLMPRIKIGNRDLIKIEFKPEKVTEEEINIEVKQLNEMLTKTINVEDEKAVVKVGDVANIDFLGKTNGKPFEGGDSKDFDLEIGSKSFIDGFEEEIIGMTKGQIKNFKITFSKQYPEKDLAGKEAVFTVTLNMIKKITLLKGKELETKLKSFGFDSKDDIVTRIREVAIEKKEQMENDKFFREYINEIIKLKDTNVIIPQEILDQEIEKEFKRMEVQIVEQGMNMKDYFKMLGTSEIEFRSNNLKDSATKRVRDGLIYSHLIEELKIEVKDEDLESEYKKIAKDSKTSIEKVKKQINKESIESNIIFIKLINKIK
ncbi:MAG: trigger factor [Mycoplasmataceae bacterium]|nr:trigger factor [Mycoplasmataceae bacterium]